jgi:tetratricopeptide (TPR) repeat protein
MNLPAKTFLAAACLLSLTAAAELERAPGGWRLKPGTAVDTKPAARAEEVLRTIDRAENLVVLQDDRAALALWTQLLETEAGTDAEAVALLGRAKLYARRGQLDAAEADLDTLFKGHANFAAFGEAVAAAYDLAQRFEQGQRRYLGGWFPWFKDPLHALTIYDKILKVAPNGPLAEESLIHAARLAEREDRKEVYNEMLERIVSDYPTSKHAAEALERLAKLRGAESLGPDYDQATTLESADHWRTLADQFPKDARSQQAAERIKELRSLSPESEAAKEAEGLLAEIAANPFPPKSVADTLLGRYPRPRGAAEAKPTAVGDDLDSLGFRKEAPKSATETERR